MYAALWRALPGGGLAKTLQCVLLFLLVVAVLFLWVFPAVAPHLPFENVTVEPAASLHLGLPGSVGQSATLEGA